MKEANREPGKEADSDLLPEYDLSGKEGVRGKYFEAYRRGHTVKISNPDGTVSIQHFALEDGAVMLDPDVRRYFPNSESVNATLRSLIKLIPEKAAKEKRPSSSSGRNSPRRKAKVAEKRLSHES